ncbi:hypothetical protein LCGC14_2008420 [marine sediment metagenome]|uniref:Uncharacterized protein n=1 Tax=marine sediment metagenome TaxID=412755 RepID=A0A0F9HY38_9ZZZZ
MINIKKFIDSMLNDIDLKEAYGNETSAFHIAESLWASCMFIGQEGIEYATNEIQEVFDDISFGLK